MNAVTTGQLNVKTTKKEKKIISIHNTYHTQILTQNGLQL